jgi:hypothetical protein
MVQARHAVLLWLLSRYALGGQPNMTGHRTLTTCKVQTRQIEALISETNVSCFSKLSFCK